MTSENSRPTPLHSWHVNHSGRMVDFAGWDMPIQYTTIVKEHEAVRNQAGLFDISHMGRFSFKGDDATSFLNQLVTIDVAQLPVGRIRYALATNDQGGIRDDILIYRLEDRILVVVNASNREKLWADWFPRTEQGGAVEFEDQTASTAMIALQGPEAAGVLEIFLEGCSQLKYYRSKTGTWQGNDFLISRTGYTGEDGFELIGTPESIVSIWEQILENHSETVTVCGLGCRDTLRLEAGMPLYGHELAEDIDPMSADLGFAVSKTKQEFRGAEQIQKLIDEGTEKIRVGLELEGKRIAREGAEILSETGDPIGIVTSGTFSPTLQKAIAMGYIARSAAETGKPLLVRVRNKEIKAFVTDIPFYKRP